MSANDETPSSKPPLSLDDAERLASQFTPLWEDVPEQPASAEPASPPPNGELPPPEAPAAAQQTQQADAGTDPSGEGPVSSERTPSMVAIARPMGSSPDIDPNSTELPAHRSDYAPPRPLAPAQRTMVGLAPPPPVQVQVPQSATTTPLGLAAPKPSRAALELTEQSAIGLEPAKPRAAVERRPTQPAYTEVSRASEPDIELPLRRKGTTRVVVGIMSVAAVLVGAGVIRTMFFKDDDTAKSAHASVEATRSLATTTAQPGKAAEPAATAEPAPVEQKTATPVPSPSTTEPEAPAGTVAPASSAAPATTDSAGPAAAAANGLRLAATHTSSESAQTKAVDTSKARTAQRVEEAKHVQHPVRTPVAPRRPHTEAASHAPASPQIPGGGTIVRQSPF